MNKILDLPRKRSQKNLIEPSVNRAPPKKRELIFQLSFRRNRRVDYSPSLGPSSSPPQHREVTKESVFFLLQYHQHEERKKKVQERVKVIFHRGLLLIGRFRELSNFLFFIQKNAIEKKRSGPKPCKLGQTLKNLKI